MSTNNALSVFFNDPAEKQWTSPFEGRGITLPAMYKAFKLDGTLSVEFLETGSTNSGDVSRSKKNHVVFQIPFEHPYTMQRNGAPVQAYAARVAMDLAYADDSLGNIDKARLEAPFKQGIFDDFYPGILNVRILLYAGKSNATNKMVSFPGLTMDTLGDFVDFVKNQGLHEMLFVGYGNAWKGCRHFISQTYLQLREHGAISAEDEDGDTLKNSIIKVHHRDSSSHDKLVDRGSFLTYDAIYPSDFSDAYE
ncbi:hypothetical protein CYLTODRAFT_446381 [Cylindrobasidium torrendii FP15055 ss-10]|uniref:DUF7770 domain-containing protein n=1 Tax=Cylindrobasidium torrendii FP15055 ss-10 TaxID=1314674 RepID=A0A0D7B0U4_9AGAR|nr:hypothetical protein CYLTODRAFT_446381 [Cylindrobasidium torrendii FP15055 ss-10]